MHQVVIVGKSRCPYCIAAVDLFRSKGLSPSVMYTDLMGSKGAKLLTDCSVTYQQDTVPFVFIGGVFLGGYDRTRAFEASGILDDMLNQGFTSETLMLNRPGKKKKSGASVKPISPKKGRKRQQ